MSGVMCIGSHSGHVSSRSCRVCGCTDTRACPGGCWWVEDDLCSECAPDDHPGLDDDDWYAEPEDTDPEDTWDADEDDARGVVKA